MSLHTSKTPVSERDTWRTPDWLFNWLNAYYNFDIDLACTRENAKVKKGIYHEEKDSLSESWSNLGEVGFCNPPYSDIGPWLEKAAIERRFNFYSVFVLPSLNGSSWQKQALKANELIFINGRIAFINSEGIEQKGNNSGTVIAIYRPSLCGEYGETKISNIDRDTIRKVYEQSEK